MTKHPARSDRNRAGTAWGADQGAHSTPGAVRPANRKWRVRRPGVSWWAVSWWAESPNTGLRHHVETQPFPTWREAMDYANREIREEQFKRAARARFIEVRPGATPSATDVRVVFRCPACMSKEAE